jgi:hypothetical protein
MRSFSPIVTAQLAGRAYAATLSRSMLHVEMAGPDMAGRHSQGENALGVLPQLRGLERRPT